MTRIAFVPSAPLLLLDGGPNDLRSAIDEAIATLDHDVVVVGAADTPGWLTGSVDRTLYGVRGTPAPDPLPLALAVGTQLLGDRPHRLWGVPAGPLPEASSYLVVGDGTAKRTARAPGHLDDRAEGFDAEVVAALAGGEPTRLAGLDRDLAEVLWVHGLAAWQAAAALPGPWRAAVTYAEAPYGVGYVVATWQRD